MEDNQFAPENPIPNELPNNSMWSKLIITCVFSLIAGAFLFSVFIFVGKSPDFLTDGQCDDMIINATNQSFINGSNYGASVFQDAIMQQSLQCEPIPFNYQDQTYNLVLYECLNLNNEGGK